jgi:hypothetical protein
MITKNWTYKTVDTDYNTIIDVSTETNIISSIIHNSNTDTTANVKFMITDTDDNIKAILFNFDVQEEDTVMLDTKVFLMYGDKLKVQSSENDVYFTISGTEG